MAELIPDERCFVQASFIFFLLMKREQSISETSAATFKVVEPHRCRISTIPQKYSTKAASCSDNNGNKTFFKVQNYQSKKRLNFEGGN